MEPETPGRGEMPVGEGPGAGWTPQKPGVMAVLIALNAAYVACGAYSVARKGKRWLAAWLLALLVWGTVCKYFICTRCEMFDRPCDYCYGGKYAALFFKKQPGRTLDIWGMSSEAISTQVMMWLPVVASWKNRKLLVLYLSLFLAAQAYLLEVCCRRCVEYSTDSWKREYCPNYRLVSRLFYRGFFR